MVEVLKRYSNEPDALERLRKTVTSTQNEPRRPTIKPRSRQIQHRLTDPEITELVRAYEGGVTVYQLADQFKISRRTVSDHLHRRGVVLRYQGLTDEQVADAARWYADGRALAKIAECYSCDPTTVWRALRQAGVTMRRPWER